jgi:hypothetical protein
MKSIFDVISEKEEELQQKRQQVKVLDEQLAKLRIAADIVADHGSDPISAQAPEPAPAPPPSRQPTRTAPAAPAKSWP